MKNLKSTLKSIAPFWQEIVFTIAIGSVLAGMTMNSFIAFQQTLNSIFFAVFLCLMVCLVGQFFWKNLFVGIGLSIVLGLGSAYMIFAALSDLMKVSEGNFQTIAGLVFGLCMFIGLTIAAISMPLKYK